MPKKTIPIHIQGAMLYNLLFEDSVRPGDSFSTLPIIINKELLYKYAAKKINDKELTDTMLPLNMITHKINLISFRILIANTKPKSSIFICVQYLLNIF